MTELTSSDIPIQSYFEARSNIRELEQRQFSTIQFFLGTFAAVMGGSIGLMQYIESVDRPLLAVAFVFLSNILSVSLFFSWCSVTLMTNRVALFCLDIIDGNHFKQRDVLWEAWVRSKRNKSSMPYLIESTLLVFLLPLITTFFLGLYFTNGGGWHLTAAASASIFGVLLLLSLYLWVLTEVKSTWASPKASKNGA